MIAQFTVTASCNVSILLGGKRGTPRLMCEEETSGWGADDIECKITVDGNEDGTIRGSLQVEVDDGTYVAQVRDMTTWNEQF